MFDKRRKTFAFESKAVDSNTFEVVGYKGTEGISRLYHYDITLISENDEIDLKKMVKHPAALVIFRDDDRFPIHGILRSFELSYKKNRFTYYRAVLVPRLWRTDRYLESQLFIDQSVPDIIKQILKQAGISQKQYTLRLTGKYAKWEYICQYRETDFDFISRWMEREGIYYYFKQGKQCETIIITDNQNAHNPIIGEDKIPYSQPSGLVPTEHEIVFALTSTCNSLPKKVVLRDYNYRKPTLDLTCEAKVDDEGFGKAYIYGEHYKTPQEGKALAKIRAEELQCREQIYNGESTVPTFAAGYFFKLSEHFREDYDQKYLITGVSHQGNQTGFLFDGQNENAREDSPDYLNTFTAIPATIQYRPERTTALPRITGTMNAKVDSQGSGQYAEIDDMGRYKVRLPFDMGDKNNMRASRWVRMAQNYAGPDYGSHFPLHKDAEVVLSFVDGNPDRPFIAAAVPNPDNSSPITSDNWTKSMIRSASGNEYHMDDKEGTQNIYTYAVRDKTTEVVNDRVKDVGNDERMTIGNNREKEVSKDQSEKIGGDKTISVKGKHKETIEKDKSLRVNGNSKVTVKKNLEQIVEGKSETRIDGEHSLILGDACKISVMKNKTEEISKTFNEKVGENMTLQVGKVYSLNAGKNITTVASNNSSEKTGKTKVIAAGKSIIIKCSGSIKIDGTSIEIVGRQGVKINGRVVELN